ncbi:MAG: citramalate synthase [Clostridiales bacterium]|nr:citramalate synthase [Clostridiales bacterium]
MIEILDTTLRDGAQGENIVFSIDDKIKIALALDQLGIDFIEGGNPAANPKDALFFEKMKSLSPPLAHAQLCAFGSTRHACKTPDSDPGLQGLLHSGAPIISLFGKSSKSQVLEVLKTTPDKNLEMIEDSIAFLVTNGRKVFFDAEHFFDGFKQDPSYAIACLKAAAKGGAIRFILCDTNGGCLPDEIYDILQKTAAQVALPLGIHCHNDSDTAVANTLIAVKAGAMQVQGTIGGIGERCGNTNLSSVLPSLILKMGYETSITYHQLKTLTPTTRYIAEIMNVPVHNAMPYVGHSAFAHKGGMHIDAVTKVPTTFEHIFPEAVGNHRRFLLSDQAGRSGIVARIEKVIPGIKRQDPRVSQILQRLKRRELKGYAYENADSSFDLMILEAFDMRKTFYTLLDYHVLTNKNKGDTSAQAFIKIEVDGACEVTAAEGDGPVNAIDRALRKALGVFYPCIQKMYLKDFSVRVLDTGGTASTVRVIIQSTDGIHIWNTVGVSSNIIHACFKALCDAVDYQLSYYQ